MSTRLALFGIVFVACVAGCARVVVTKNPSDCDEGLRFYRPKPYLLVAPADDKQISIELKYLPDYTEEYSIRMTPGINASTSFTPTLSDGWNLTGFKAEADQNVDDLIKAVAGVIPNLKVAVTSEVEGSGAQNIPLGFYEGVIAQDERGCKQLIGWRYVGFFPHTCSTSACSTASNLPCADTSLWRLVWQEKGLVFEPMQ